MKLTDEQTTAQDISLILDVLVAEKDKLACLVVVAVDGDRRAEVLSSTSNLPTIEVLQAAAQHCIEAENDRI